MLLFIDIETVPVVANVEDLSAGLFKHWERKKTFLRLTDEEQLDDALAYQRHAGIFAEWSKVICIGLGYQKGNKLRLKAFSGDNEMEVLERFGEVIEDFSKHERVLFCGHNIKEFDIPFLCRRLIVNKMPLPKALDLAGLKPWENEHIDTMNLWKFGEWKRFTSLDLLAHALDIPSSKTEIDGSQVAETYYRDKNLDGIVQYCLDDVFTTAQLYYRLSQQYSMELEREYV